MWVVSRYLGSAWLITVVVMAAPVMAATPIFKCTKDGKTVYTDRACDSTGAPAADPAVTGPGAAGGTTISAAPTVIGDWRGQTQFQAGVNGVRVAEAHSVAPLVLTFSADGKVTGSSPDNGCQVLGVWSPGVTPRLFNLDVSLNSCQYGKFNQRYSGTLIATFPERMAQLSLIANVVPILGQPFWRFDVGGTLRR